MGPWVLHIVTPMWIRGFGLSESIVPSFSGVSISYSSEIQNGYRDALNVFLLERPPLEGRRKCHREPIQMNLDKPVGPTDSAENKASRVSIGRNQ